MSRADGNLRKQNSFAGSFFINIRTSTFKPNEPKYRSPYNPYKLTRQIVKVALWYLKRIYKGDFNYAKKGVML